MKSSSETYKQRVIKRGVQDINLVVSEVKGWFDDNDYDWGESQNITKDKDKGNEIGLTFEGERAVDEYFKREIKVEFLITKAQKIKAKDMVLDQADTEIIITGALTTDYQNLFHSRFAEFLKKIKDKYFTNKLKNDQLGKLYGEVQGLLGVIKESLGLP